MTMRNPSILKKFRQEKPGGPVTFIGNTCIVKILEKFESLGCLQIADTVKTLGVFDMEVDGEQTGMFLVGHIEMHPSDVETEEENGSRYIKLTFHHGDKFMTTTETVLEERLGFFIWLVYVKYGKMLAAMSYYDQATFFDRMMDTCGISFPVDHSVFEAIFAHLSRSMNDFTIPFRNTDMKGELYRISLGDVTHASRSTSARFIGAYFNDGINAALVRPNTTNSLIEDLLRQ